MTIALVRRSFLQAFGLAVGGLAVGWSRDAKSAGKQGKTEEVAAKALEPNVFVHVALDGTTSLVCHRSEMGQGVRSTIPALMADEMGADMKRVKIVQADGDKAFGDQNTDGSSSIRSEYEELRRLGAVARTLLVSAAAKKWNVEPASCLARDHQVVHVPTKRAFDFSALVADAAKLPIPKHEDVALRPDAELTHVFKDLPLVDGPDIVTGKAQFGADIRLPNMLIAMAVRPPVAGGKVKSYDASKAISIPGVKKVVEMPALKMPFGFQPLGGVAVIAETTWAAMKGCAALSIEWDAGDNAKYDSVEYHDALLEAVRKPGDVVRKVGDVDGAMTKSARKIEAEYYVPHLAHAPMEPPAALASFDAAKGTCEIWAPTQNPQDAREEASKALSVDESKVTVHTTLLGGAFGRKSKPDYVAEAALLSKQLGIPIRMQWTREDDIQHDYYHSVAAHRLSAGLDASNRVIALLHRNAFPSISATFKNGVTHGGVGELQQGMLDYPYAIPNVRAENCAALAHVRIGWLRSVHNIHNAFAIGSFVDEIAAARNVDPRENLLEIVGPARTVSKGDLGVADLPNYHASLDEHPIDTGRLRAVIERVTAASKWSELRKAGRAVGLHAHRSFLTYTAVVVALAKTSDGKLRVDEAWIAADAGKVVNTERARSQLEGAVVFGISIALHGEITMKDGAVQQSNFRDYKVARIGEVPKGIHVEIVKSDHAPGGIGEPGVPPVAPAIANAVFAATGKRVRELPLAKSGLF